MSGIIARFAPALAGPFGWILAYWKFIVMALLFCWAMAERHAKVELRVKATQDALAIADALNTENARVTTDQGKVSNEDQRRDATRIVGDKRTTDAVRLLNIRLAEQAKRLAAANTSLADLRTAASTNGELFGSCVSEYRDLGSEAAIARQRGLAAEGYYDALKGKP